MKKRRIEKMDRRKSSQRGPAPTKDGSADLLPEKLSGKGIQFSRSSRKGKKA